MTTVAQAAYEKTPIGSVGAMQASKGQSIIAFQADVLEAERMESAGLIVITSRHRESETGKRQIDALMFKRLA